MVFSPGHQRIFVFHVSVQLILLAGCETLDLFSFEAIAQPLKPRPARQGSESSSRIDSEDGADGTRLTALVSEAAAMGDATNIILSALRTNRGQNYAATGILEEDVTQRQTFSEGDDPPHAVPATAVAGPALHDPPRAVVQPTRGQASPDWMQIHHSAAYALHLPHCPLDCVAEWVGDGWCDTECNHEVCNFDGGDCHGWCGGECRPHWPGDGECDLECYKEECQWDGGDCSEWQEQKLPSMEAFKQYVETYKHLQLIAEPGAKPDEVDRQFLAELYSAEATNAHKPQSAAESSAHEAPLPEENRTQDEKDSTSERRHREGEHKSEATDRNGGETKEQHSPYKYDTGTANHDALLRMVRGDACECSVKEGKLGNGVCNPECNTYACHFDGFDCYQMCSLECPHVWLGDGKCDKECDIPECFYDKGDCWECAPDCRLWMIGNNICDRDCNVADCWFDHGDCNDITKVVALDYTARPYVYQFCAKDFIGDGKCDENCYNEESAWDAGDCAGVEFTEGKVAEK